MKNYYLLLLFALLCLSCENDDDTVPACLEVTSITANDITATSATVNWLDSDNTGNYTVEYGISGFALGSGTTLNVTTTSTILSGLMAETTYDVYVKTVCSADNSSMYSDAINFSTPAPPVVAEFLPTLSQLNLYNGNLSDLTISPYAFKYELITPLFTDYAIKQRFIALPEGETLTFDGDGLPLFPDNTVIAKTFYYNNNETDLSQGKKILETRLLIKINDVWETGDYKWNDTQTEAVLDNDGSVVPVTWIDAQGETNSINYEIPSTANCITCHSSNDVITPIGPKLRTMNYNINGINQLQSFINNGYLEGLTDPITVNTLPKWDDTNYTLEERARAYMDINCAHCHTEGGTCEIESDLRLSYETEFEETYISLNNNSILARIQNTIPEYGMPLIGTTILNDEGVSLMMDYINSLE